jgi:hypothetical protein
MATYRQVQIAFWQDEFVLQLTPEEKYFYLYLLTNSKTKQCGIYQLPMPIIIIETGYNQETAEKLLMRFCDYGKIIYNTRTKEIAILNWPKYNPMSAPKVRVCVEKELREVKDKSLIEAVFCSGTPLEGVSQEEKEEEKEKAEEEAEEKEERAREASPPAPADDNLFSKSNPVVILSEAKNLILSSPTASAEGGNRGSIPPLLSSSDDHPDYTCNSIQMQAELLIIRLWNKQKPNPEEVRITAVYIEKFGFSEVETAFTEAVKYDKKKLAYVETVCERRKERADLVKKNELERQKRLEAEKKIEEQKKAGVGLGLIKAVYQDDVKSKPAEANI